MSATSNIVMIVTAENKASQILQQVKQQVDQTGQQIEQTNAKVAASVQKVERNYLQAGAGFATVGASATSLATSFSVLDKAQTAVVAQQTSLARANDTLQRSTTDLESKQLALARAEEALNKLRERGLEGTRQFELAEQKVALASQKLSDAQAKLKTDQQNVETITLRLRDAQNNLSDTYANFIAGLAPQMISMVFGLQTAFKALGITSVTQLIPAIHGVGAAMKAAFLTPPPIALIIAGVATVVALLVTNFGGFRDAVIQVGNEIFKFIQQHVKPLADLLSWLNVNVIQPVAQALGLTTVNATKDAEQAFHELKQETIDLGHGIASTKQEIEAMIPTLDPGLTTAGSKVTEALKGTEAIAQRNIEMFGAMGKTALESNALMAGSFVRAAQEIVPAGEKLTGIIRGLRQEIAFLQGLSLEQASFYGLAGNLGKVPKGSIAEMQARMLFDQMRGQQIASSVARGTSLGLAAGAAFEDIFGGFFTLGNQVKLANISLAGQPALAGLTPLGTSFVSTETLEALRSVQQAISQGIITGESARVISNFIGRAGFVGSFSSTGINVGSQTGLFRAQHGFEGMINKPTLFLAGEAGSEHVKITPGSRSTRPAVIQLILDGHTFAEAIIDDIDELLTTKTVPTKLKVKGVRLQ